ncbi:MAG: hypothetical protein JO054_11000 [Actinobacteria bacterium]|nr:hypothetical protein [Actinomycetota bacterium]MBV9254752.1 hypothetical protein [Actinomycetota bacterium]
MLMLVPAAVLVLIALAAIAVDSAVVFLAQRQAGDLAAAAANDAAGAALSEGAFYGTGKLSLDPARVTAVVADAVTGRGAGLDLVGPPDVTVAGRQVCVTVHANVRYPFSPAVPGVARTRVVTARAAATAVEGRGAVPASMGLC